MKSFIRRRGLDRTYKPANIRELRPAVDVSTPDMNHGSRNSDDRVWGLELRT